MELAGKVCLITGGARRIGRAIALRMAQGGAHVAIHYGMSEEDARETAEACSKSREDVRVECFQADLRSPAELETLLAEVNMTLGRVDILINSAAVFRKTPVMGENADRWEQMIDVNLRAPIRLSKRLAPGMIERGEGVIINISDALLHPPRSLYSAYNVSKNALEAITQSLAVELAPAVRVNAIAPGVVLLPEGADASLEEKLISRIPLARTGNPDDIASACLFLVQSDYITGAILPVDGGASLVQHDDFA